MRGYLSLLKPGRKPKNKAEADFWVWAHARGYKTTKRGWPDFFVWNEKGEVILVEVKAHRSRKLKREQKAVLRALAGYGVPCFRWSPDSGFTRIGTGDPLK